MTIAGLVLAGGASRRMGSEKAFVPLAGAPMLAHVIRRFAPQVGPLAINANGDPARFADFSLPVVGDDKPDTGPLGGVLAGLRWAAGLDGVRHLATVPVDSPFLPGDVVNRLAAVSRASDGTVAIAASGERDHPVVALWPIELVDRLDDWRRTAKSHGVRGFLAATGFTVVAYPLPQGGPDPFFNVNTTEDLSAASQWLASNSSL